MKVCLIRPQQLVTKSSIGNKAAAPLGIAFLAAMLQKHGYEVVLLDAIAEDPDRLSEYIEDVYVNGLSIPALLDRIPTDADIIGFSLMFTMNWIHDRKLIQEVRSRFPDKLLIAGGEHITALPEYSMIQSGLDVCVLGEGELTLIDLLNTLQSGGSFATVNGIAYLVDGKCVFTAKRRRQLDINELPWPSWDLLPINKYFEHGMVFGVDRGNCLPIMASRGCPYRCTFCSSPDMWGTRYVLRTVDDVVNEMENLHKKYGVQNIDFYDLTAIIKRDWIVNLCKELIKRKVPITWQLPSGTRSEAIDNEVAHLMYLSGCRNVTYAPESGSEELLKIILKKVKLNSLLLSAKYSVQQKLNVKVNIIVGLPDETHRHLWKTILFLVKCSWLGIHDTTPGLFYPYPGSKIFNDLLDNGEVSLENDDYLIKLIFTDSFTRNYTYNKNMSVRWIRFYQLLILATFYGTNYLFRPIRLFRTLSNIYLKKYESRFEMTFADLLKSNKLSKKIEKSEFVQVSDSEDNKKNVDIV